MKRQMICGVIVVFSFFSISLQSQDLIDSEYGHYDVRPLTEINQYGFGDAYPWISEDGQRLYYTSHNYKDSLSSIYYAHRQSSSEAFGDHKEYIHKNGTKNILSCWLTPDELTMSYVVRERILKSQTAVYLTQRESIDQEFGEAQKLILLGGIRGTILSPSFSPDLNELFAFNEYNGNAYILFFEKSGFNQYTYKGEIKFPNRYRVMSGRLSGNGLEYYVGLEKEGEKPKLYILTRNNVNEHFSKLDVFTDVYVNDENLRNHQAYFSGNKNYVVFTRSEINDWTSNEIYIAERIVEHKNPVVFLESHLKKSNLDNLVIYPNPTKDFVNIKNPDLLNLKVSIFDMNGQWIKSFEHQDNEKRIPLIDWVNGQYIFRVESPEGDARQFRVIKVD